MVVLVGPNGAGKTNCIEAISFLSPGRGLRRATLDDVADNQGDGSWAVSAEVEGALGLATLGTGIDPPVEGRQEAATSRRCRIDREPVTSATAFGDHLRMVWLTPAMDGLFMGAASERRRFFDRLVLAIDSRAFQPGLGAGALACARATVCWRCAITTTLVRRDRARNRRACGRGGGDARPDRARGCAAMLRARGEASVFPSATIMLDGWMENALLSEPAHRRGGPLPRDPARRAARATPPPAAPWTARISPTCR